MNGLNGTVSGDFDAVNSAKNSACDGKAPPSVCNGAWVGLVKTFIGARNYASVSNARACKDSSEQ